MKKLHLVSAMYASKGHGQEYVRNFCYELMGHYNIVLHLATNSEIEAPEGIQITYTGVDYKRTEAQNFNRYSFFASYFRAIFKQLLSAKYYRKVIKSDLIDNGDLVYIMDYDVIPLKILIDGLKRKGTRIFLWIHSAKFESKNVLYTAYKSIFKKMFNSFISNDIEGVVVNGDFIKEKIEFYLKIPKDKVHVIQYPSSIPFNPINKEAARKKLGISSKDNVVMSFGMLRKDKNIEFLIKSIAQVDTKVLLVIVGSEASVTRKDIENWIDKYNLKSYKLEIDYISEERMALYYSASDLLLLTYNIESGSQSGPLSLAREFELPAIVSNSGEIGRYVQHSGVGLVADLNIKDDFIKKIDRFFNSEDCKIQIASNIKKAKEMYSWKSAKKKYLEVFDAKKN
ncbi:glycosyltransferase family 4 protein [Flagellimonas iocasae]|uniref:Glycosyltransferase family 4 protein n=1 Tax=Flagellimonas iocasae TaxID=2055905 RepID=A0ABW4XXG8_9FLAO